MRYLFYLPSLYLQLHAQASEVTYVQHNYRTHNIKNKLAITMNLKWVIEITWAQRSTMLPSSLEQLKNRFFRKNREVNSHMNTHCTYCILCVTSPHIGCILCINLPYSSFLFVPLSFWILRFFFVYLVTKL